MAGRLLRRVRRNPRGVVSVLVRDVLLSARAVVGLVAAGVALVALVQAAGALSAGALVSAAVFGLVGTTAAYGAGQSALGRPLRGASVALAGLLVVGGGAHALGIGPAASDAPGVESTPEDGGWADRDHTVHVGADGLNAHEDEGSPSDVGLSSRDESDLG